MRAAFSLVLAAGMVSSAFAQATDPPLEDTRLTIHTLVREDVFAGWRSNNMERLERAERNIETLLEQRPDEKAELLAWKGGAHLYRAVLAHEAGDAEKFKDYYDKATELFSEARNLDRENIGVCAVCGGSLLMFGDRLPEDVQADAWSASREDYLIMWKQQGQAVAHMPLHISGELLAGLAQSAHRTGRQQEADKYLDKIIELLPDSGYAKEAEKWKADPAVAASTNLACKSCHKPGRLVARLKELE